MNHRLPASHEVDDLLPDWGATLRAWAACGWIERKVDSGVALYRAGKGLPGDETPWGMTFRGVLALAQRRDLGWAL